MSIATAPQLASLSVRARSPSFAPPRVYSPHSPMLKPDRLLQLFIELIFVLLGGLLAWLGTTHHVFFDRSGAGWSVLSAAVILWGLRSLYKPGQWWSRWRIWTRVLSLVLVG